MYKNDDVDDDDDDDDSRTIKTMIITVRRKTSITQMSGTSVLCLWSKILDSTEKCNTRDKKCVNLVIYSCFGALYCGRKCF